MLADVCSLLFVPGNRPERYAKAGASGADLVCIDLEDAVAPADRVAARVAVMDFLRTQPKGHRYGVRINRLPCADALRDVLALHEAQAAPAFVMLAKTESAEQLVLLTSWLPGIALIALVESARGLAAAREIATAAAPVQALLFGGVDFAAELGAELAWEPMLHARLTLVAAAAMAKLACLDVPWLDVTDAAGAQAEARRVAALGFSGKALIHPSQVAPVHAAWVPTQEALARARRVVAACGANDAAVLVDGQLVDRPVVLAALRTLGRAEA